MKCILEGRGVTLILWALSRGNEFQGLAATANSVDWNSLIQSGQFTLLVNSQTQEIDVRDLSMGDDRVGLKDFQDAEIFGPKMVTWCFTNLAKDRNGIGSGQGM